MKFRDIVTIILCLLFVTVGSVVYRSAHAQVSRPDLIEVLTIRSEIDQGVAASVKEAVEKINENPKVKAVLLVVDTPGGSASASDYIYDELSKIKVPVVGYCEYMCASGGVYALMAPSVKFIGVRGETIGGSVGVVMHLTRFNRLLDYLKIDNETFKSGALKDAGNPTRELTSEDRKYLQSIVDELADKFYGIVVKARPKADLAELKTAKIFIGEKIVKVGLADQVMSYDAAVAKAKQLSGSKLIFTRDEIRKMSKSADVHADMDAAGAPKPQMTSRWESDLGFLIETLREIRQGETMRFDYRLPFRF